MAILKYIPPIQKIIDKRTDKGGYYEAICENCGTMFYPERSNAKYCSPNCGLIQHRKAKAEILAAGGKIEAKKKTKEDEVIYFRGSKSIYEYLKKKYNTHGDRLMILESLKETSVNEFFIYHEDHFYRISELKWVLPL